MQIFKKIGFTFFFLLSFIAQADDADRNSAYWLADFFKFGINSVFAECEMKTNETGGQHFYKRKNYTVSFDNETKTYRMLFHYEYRNDWNVLTDNGSHPPIKEEPHFVGSSISSWNNQNGLGVYIENYEHKLPNWMIFETLDSLIINLSKFGQYTPPLTGIFRKDELNAMKKVFKKEMQDGKLEGILSCFDFDEKGNLMDISHDYMNSFSPENLSVLKPINDYSVVIRNKSEQVIFLKPILSKSETQFMEGVMFKFNDKSVKIYSFELNKMLHKFLPFIFNDPEWMFNQYLLKLQKEADLTFTRFSSQ